MSTMWLFSPLIANKTDHYSGAVSISLAFSDLSGY